jgi:hypothetical protein
MRKFVTILGLLVVLGGAAFLYLFHKDFVVGLFKKSAQEAKELVGTGPARTPDEALSRFKDAIKARDYKTAASYCNGTYAEQMQLAADEAGKLGQEIDGLVSLADKFNIRLTDESKKLLHSIDPSLNHVFRANFDVVNDVKKQGDDRAIATVTGKDLGQFRLEVRLEGKADDKSWKIRFPDIPNLRASTDGLIKKGKDYAKALEKIKDHIRAKSIITKDDLESELKSELAQAAK